MVWIEFGLGHRGHRARLRRGTEGTEGRPAVRLVAVFLWIHFFNLKSEW